MSNANMIESHFEQIKFLEIERNRRVLISTSVEETVELIKGYNEDIQAYEDDIEKLQNGE